jgi:hypothetical protein
MITIIMKREKIGLIDPLNMVDIVYTFVKKYGKK